MRKNWTNRKEESVIKGKLRCRLLEAAEKRDVLTKSVQPTALSKRVHEKFYS